MHERFSDRARHAMALANLEATELRHNYLAPAHLMLGLVREGTCVAAEALSLFDVDLDHVREDVRGHLSPQDGEADRLGRRAHSQSLKEVIRLAIEEARKFNHRYVGTEHLVLAILSQADSIPAQVLRKHGVSLPALREKTLALLRTSVDAGHDLAHSRHGDFEWVHQQELSKAFRSPEFWHAMILAVDSANRLGSGSIEPVHLLLGLLRDSTNGVSAALREKGVTADWVRAKLAHDNGSDPDGPAR